MCSKTRRHARCEHLTKRSEVSWSATAECDGGTCQGRRKKYYPSAAQVWRFFLSRLLYPCKYVFAKQRERLTNTFLPALFSVGRFSAAFGKTRTSSVLLSFARKLERGTLKIMCLHRWNIARFAGFLPNHCPLCPLFARLYHFIIGAHTCSLLFKHIVRFNEFSQIVCCSSFRYLINFLILFICYPAFLLDIQNGFYLPCI